MSNWVSDYEKGVKEDREFYIKQAIAARDKEWVEWLLKAWQYCGLGCSKHISLKFSITSGTIVTECFFLEDSCRVWQDRKKEIGYEL